MIHSRRRAWAVGVALALLLAVACAGDPDSPPQIAWGADICDHCRMIVSDERHAAAARSAEGVEARFDDPGCLARFLDARDDADSWRAWGHDEEGRWRPVDELAWIEVGPGATPMGSGLVGYSSPAAAATAAPAADEGGRPIAWHRAAERLLSRAD